MQLLVLPPVVPLVVAAVHAPAMGHGLYQKGSQAFLTMGSAHGTFVQE